MRWFRRRNEFMLLSERKKMLTSREDKLFERAFPASLFSVFSLNHVSKKSDDKNTCFDVRDRSTGFGGGARKREGGG